MVPPQTVFIFRNKKADCIYEEPLILFAHTHTHTHTVHMALVGYLIVFSFVTKPGQTLEFLLWGTIVPLNFLLGYHCSIVASTPQPMAYASSLVLHTLCGHSFVLVYLRK